MSNIAALIFYNLSTKTSMSQLFTELCVVLQVAVNFSPHAQSCPSLILLEAYV